MSYFFDTVPTGYTFDDMLLVPAYSKVMSRKDPSLKSEIVEGLFFDVPIVSANMPKITEAEMINEICSLGGTGCFHRFMSKEKLIEQIKRVDRKHKGRWGISLGVNLNTIQTTLEELRETNVTAFHSALSEVGYIVVDVAHGHHTLVEKALLKIREELQYLNPTSQKNNCHIKLIVGNVCTVAAAKDLILWGADAIKVGVGPGAVCSTRTTCGVGYPQLSAIKNISGFVKKYNEENFEKNVNDHIKAINANEEYVRYGKCIKVIADGGIKTSGDIVKALAAGADFVMLGSMIAGCKETPGQALTLADGSVVKVYGGSASIDTQATFKGTESKDIVPEGVTTLVKYKGGLRHVMGRLVGGVKSGFSYCGCKDVQELHEYGEFPDSWVRTTLAGYIEGTPHITNSK